MVERDGERGTGGEGVEGVGNTNRSSLTRGSTISLLRSKRGTLAVEEEQGRG